MPNTRVMQRKKLSATDKKRLHKDLLAKQREVNDMYRHDIQVGQTTRDDNSDDFADRANNSYCRETMFALSTTERTHLLEIEDALKRFDDDSYGACVNCASAIGLQRLQAVPWAKCCIDCQELVEKGLLEI